MKKLLFVIMLLFSSIIYSQTLDEAFSSGNVDVILKSCDKELELSFDNNDSTYSIKQAKNRLKRFYKKNNIKSFYVLHKGGSETKYTIGNLITEKGNYRLHYFMKENLLYQIMIIKN